MDDATTTPTTTIEEPRDPAAQEEVQEELVLEELLVEDVSIDGMCGVY